MFLFLNDGYDIYRIVEEEPVLINHPPYNDNIEDWDLA